MTVSNADYTKLAMAWVRDHDGEGVVVNKKRDLAQWRAWIAYADHLSAKKGRVWRTLENLTVPTAWPQEFDSNAPFTLE